MAKAKQNKLSIQTKYAKFIIATILVIIVLAIAFSILNMIFTNKPIPPSGGVVESSVRKIGELASLEYGYRNVIPIDDPDEWKLFGLFDIDPGEVFAAIQYDGRIKLGIKLDKIKIEESQNGENEKKSLIIQLPEIVILSHEEIDGSEIEIANFKKFTKRDIDHMRWVEEKSKRRSEIEEDLKKTDIFDQARVSAKERIENLIFAIPDVKSNYVIEWVE
jgi:hypothetical protein